MHRLLAIGAAALGALVSSGTASAWSWPADGEVLRPFTMGSDAYAAGQHRGIDVAGAEGSAVRSPASGSVTFAGSVPTHGRGVTILTADGYSVTLFHLGAVGVAKGDVVQEGSPVGTLGWSGDAEHAVPSVHLGIRVASQAEGYVDPLGLLPPRAAPPTSGPPAAPAPAPSPAPSPAPAPPPGGQALPAPAPAPAAPTPAAPPAPSVAAPAPASPAASTEIATSAQPSGAAPDATQVSDMLGSVAEGHAGSGVVVRRGVSAPGGITKQAGVQIRAAGGTAANAVPQSRSAAPSVDAIVVARTRVAPIGPSRPSTQVVAVRATGSPQIDRRGEPVLAPVGRDRVTKQVVGTREPSPSLPSDVRLQVIPGREAHGRDRPGAVLVSASPGGASATADRERFDRSVGGLLVVLLAVCVAAGAWRLARRIGRDGAVLPDHADLLRELDAAHRSRVHDRGGGRVRTTPAPARP